MTLEEQIRDHLAFIYGEETAGPVFEDLRARLDAFRRQHPTLSYPIDPTQRVTETDSVLITYGDQVQEPDKPPLQSLAEVLEANLEGTINTVHILPFYPYSSDDGFSVIDYKQVNPDFGDWEHIAAIGRHFRLMFDAVINHISAESDWFQGFLQGDPRYQDYFITESSETDLRSITRPRTSPLLTPVETPSGRQYVWTTFSADQIDLNFKNPALLLEIIDVLLFYVAHGAELIRMDAIAYIWKEIGTTSIHMPQAHRVVQLFRTIFDLVAPYEIIITETNVPHKENVSYFGDGENEAQLVYQFTLPPLTLHTFQTGDASVMQQWAAGLEDLPDTAAFFNFIASHDGIGVRPAEGILTAEEVQQLIDKTEAHGGLVSYKTNPDGSQSAYELNITLFDALSDPNNDEPAALQIDRFMASQALMLAMTGVPGIYVHSLFGSSNNHIGVKETGRARTINREKWLRAEVEAGLANPKARGYKIFQRYKELLQARASHKAFHPNGPQQILTGQPHLFSLVRTAPDGSERALCIHNVTAQPQPFEANLADLSLSQAGLRDILTGQEIEPAGDRLRLTLAPYEVKWLAG